MAWHSVIQELERKLTGALRGTYRPLDGVPLFRVQYPPSQEREALRQFSLLAERFRERGRQTRCIFLTRVLESALSSLLNAAGALHGRLEELERSRDRQELQRTLSEHLPDEMLHQLVARLKDMPPDGVAILLRMGALYPFMRPSSLGSRLEGAVVCAIVFPYPGTTLGALLDEAPASLHGGYYRGEVIAWRRPRSGDDGYSGTS